MKNKFLFLILAAAAGTLIREKCRERGSSPMAETADEISRNICDALKSITHKNPEEIRRFVGSLASPSNQTAVDFPEIERIELAFKRTDSASVLERAIAIAYRSKDEIKIHTVVYAMNYDSVPDEIIEEMIRSNEKTIVFSLYRKTGDAV